jgi:hypothetical protein
VPAVPPAHPATRPPRAHVEGWVVSDWTMISRESRSLADTSQWHSAAMTRVGRPRPRSLQAGTNPGHQALAAVTLVIPPADQVLRERGNEVQDPGELGRAEVVVADHAHPSQARAA